MTKKISEQSGGQQLASILGIVALVVALFGSISLIAADAVIDDKYATDADLKAVQETVAAQVGRIEVAVNKNTTAVTATAGSVDGLTLVVMDLQIDKVEEELRAMDRDKRTAPSSWSERDEDQMRDKQKALADLNTQREILFARLIANQGPST